MPTTNTAKLVIFIIAGQHGDEPEGLCCASELMSCARAALGSQHLVKFYGMLNPEGFARARRHRDDNVDPNRVWGTEQQTELQARILDEIAEISSSAPVLVLDCHSATEPPHLLSAGKVGALVAEQAGCAVSEQRRDGSLLAWCEDRGIPAIAVESVRGGDHREATQMARECIASWVAVNMSKAA